MAVPTNVLENGRWITRMLDPYQILAQNRVPHVPEVGPAAASSEPPNLALLTQTLVRSPVLKEIYPARIRHQTINDVLLVSEDSVQIVEAHPDYTLEPVAVMADFDAPIRSCNLFGLPRRLTNSEAFVKEDTIQGAHDNLPLNWHDNTGHQNMARGHLSPQILILVLDNAKIIFLYAFSRLSEQPQFMTSQFPLPRPSSSPLRLHRLGEHLAVDPTSRAFAVGAQENHVYLYALKSWQTLDSDLEQNLHITPIISERALTLDGIILKMVFLHPVEDDRNHITLLLLVTKNAKSKLVWYEWDTRIALHEAPLKPNKYALPNAERLPLMLIPLLYCNTFLIVNGSRICAVKNLLTGTPEFIQCDLRKGEEPEDLASSKRRPMWVRWARPIQSSLPFMTSADDSIYLFREDGLLEYIRIMHHLPQLVDNFSDSGRLGVNVDGPIAIIDLGSSTDDLLITGGDCGVGGHWRLTQHKITQHDFTRGNWTPVNDIVTALTSEADVNAHTGIGNSHRYQRLFASVGKNREGSVTELDLGVSPLKLLDSIDLAEAVNETILDLWTLRSTEDGIYILLSHPSSSSLIRLCEDCEPELLNHTVAFDLDARTVLAMSFGYATACQITTRAIRIISANGSPGGSLAWEGAANSLNEEIIHACLKAADDSCYLAIIFTRRDHHYIQLGKANRERGSLGEPLALAVQPTCIAIHIHREMILIFVSSVHGSIDIYESPASEIGHRLNKVGEWKSQQSHEICDSMAVFDSKDRIASNVFFIICGLRNGQINTLCCEADQFTTTLSERIAVGHTSVTVKPQAFKNTGVLVHCEKALYTLDYPSLPTRYTIGRLRPIHLDKFTQLGHSRGAVLAFGQTDNVASTSKDDADIYFALASGVIHAFKSRHLATSFTPRRYEVRGTPFRLTYSHRLKKIIVLLSRNIMKRRRQGNGIRSQPGKRACQSILRFLDVKDNGVNALDAKDLEKQGDDDHTSQEVTLVNRPGEVMLGVTEWFPKIGENEYHMLVVNTLIKDHQRSSTGRILLYAISRGENDSIQVNIKKSIELNSPAFSIKVHWDRQSIIYCCGKELTVQCLEPNPSGIKFGVPTKITMRSPGRCITLQGDLIYVSAASESLQAYRYQHSKLQYWHGDTVSRFGVAHAHDQSTGIVLATSMTGSITGLWAPPVNQANNSMINVFEGNLPKIITRLLPMSRPDWTRDVLIPGGPILLKQDLTSLGHNEQSKELGQRDLGTADYRSKAFIGTSTDGAITQLLILERGWQLLKFVQNMCEGDSEFCPDRTKRAKRHLDPSTANPRFLHVDGDILNRLLSGDACAGLARLMSKPAPRKETDAGLRDFECVNERWKHIKEFSAEVLGEENVQSWNVDVLLMEIARWIAYVMRSSL